VSAQQVVKVGIYARVSTDAQEARGTIGSQLEALHQKVTADGVELVGEYIDDGVSGARLDRPGLDALRDAAEAGLFDQVWCLTPDRLSRSYAYQVLISDELARHGVSIFYLDAPAIDSDPQARLLVQIQSVIAEYERAKISERSRRGKLFRARAGEAVAWRAPFGYLRVPRQGDRLAHLVINEEQAAVVRRIFADYTTGGLSLRQITLALNKEGIATPTGRYWSTGALGRLLRRETYVGRLQVNTWKMVSDRGPGAQPRQVRRPKEEWITVPCPPIIDEATFQAAGRTCAANTNFSARRLNPNEEAWLLRGLVFCECGTRSIVDRGQGPNGGIHYYACRNRLGLAGNERTCRQRTVRADGLDTFVFDQIRAALSSPEILLAGEQAIAAHRPTPDDELLGAELTRLERRIEATTTERRRIADLYQGGVIEADELARRAKDVDDRAGRLTSQRDELAAQRQELGANNRLRSRVENFACRVLATLDELDFAQRQRLVRLLVERVEVRGWQVDVHLRIPLDGPDAPTPDADHPSDEPPAGVPIFGRHEGQRNRRDRRPAASPAVSNEDRLRSIGHGERVAEGDVLGHVPRRKCDAPASLEALDGECARQVALDDAPALAVADELTGSPPELAVVLQGHDLVADTGPPVRDPHALALDLAPRDEVLPAASRQRVDSRVVAGHEKHCASLVARPSPELERLGAHLRLVPAGDPVPRHVLGEHAHVACPQPERGLGLPGLRETAHRLELARAV
jgi:site-specific DNA recombinase